MSGAERAPDDRAVALVTGGSGGIGSAICRRLAADGWRVAIGCLNAREAAEQLALELNGVALAFDVADDAQARAAIATLGEVALLVNNAGVADYGLFQLTTERQRERVFAVNAFGAMNCSAAVLPQMIRARRGSIINLASIWGKVGASCEVVYSASKAALIGFTKALAKEVAPSGVRVNCVAPGVVATAMTSRFSESELAELGAIAQPADVANAVAFLASDHARLISGETLTVNAPI
ncbi:MAG: SDR family NAD(P)-dependent oxidoreductase [Oscillospiraceae bacterium]|nr:SDR family NAD(P)-dependent oxidoreductase [Oscillospiraceae bacterium]